MKNYAYVTLMTHNEYMIPAMVLIDRWKQTKSIYPLYIMITSRITKENVDILSMLGYHIIYIEEYIPTNYLKIFNAAGITWQSDLHGTSLEKGGWVHSFNKFQVWRLTQFEKVCFLDLDLFILHNLDNVFDYSEFTCAWREDNEVCSQIFIAEPNLRLYEAICNFANNYIIPFERYGLENVLYVDEDIFRDFFKIKQYLPQNYDYQCYDRHGWKGKNTFIDWPKAIHFTSKAKPWLNGREYIHDLDLNNNYLYVAAWMLYIDIYENIIQTLHQKGVHYGKI